MTMLRKGLFTYFTLKCVHSAATNRNPNENFNWPSDYFGVFENYNTENSFDDDLSYEDVMLYKNKKKSKGLSYNYFSDIEMLTSGKLDNMGPFGMLSIQNVGGDDGESLNSQEEFKEINDSNLCKSYPENSDSNKAHWLGYGSKYQDSLSTQPYKNIMFDLSEKKNLYEDKNLTFVEPSNDAWDTEFKLPAFGKLYNGLKLSNTLLRPVTDTLSDEELHSENDYFNAPYIISTFFNRKSFSDDKEAQTNLFDENKDNGYILERATFTDLIGDDYCQKKIHKFTNKLVYRNKFIYVQSALNVRDSEYGEKMCQDRTNNFQIVICSNGYKTYAILNYGAMNWGQNEDSTTGVLLKNPPGTSITLPGSRYAKSRGYANAWGDDHKFYLATHSGSNIDKKRQYMYDITGKIPKQSPHHKNRADERVGRTLISKMFEEDQEDLINVVVGGSHLVVS